MSEPQPPSLGPPSRDPTAAARLLAAASDVGLRVERARNELEWLAHTTGALASAAGVPPAPRRPPGAAAAADAANARRLAIDLAVGGTPREVIDDEVRRRYPREESATAGRERPRSVTVQAAGPGHEAAAEPESIAAASDEDED